MTWLPGYCKQFLYKMPTKKKKSGKKKSRPKSSKGLTDPEILPDGVSDNPTTTMSEGAPNTAEKTGKKKKKKGRKKTMTRSEKALAKLDKAAEKIQSSTGDFNKFLKRIENWFSVYYPRAKELFRRFDEDGDGCLSFEEFKSGMYDLNAPCTTIELHLLCNLLEDKDSGAVDYTRIASNLHLIREKEGERREAEASKTRLILSDRNIDHCHCCKLGLWHPYIETNPRYLEIEMRLVTFDSFEDHPAHFEVILHAHAPVFTLVRLVTEETDIQSTTIAIFSDPSRSPQALLPPEKTLEDCGFEGGPVDDPDKITLFYDYTVEFTDCPLLLCDHYFGQK